MNQYEFNQLLEKYLAGECNPDEEKLIEDWQQNLLKDTSLQLDEQEKIATKKRLWQAIAQRTLNIKANPFSINHFGWKKWP